MYVFVDLRLFSPFNVILILILHIEIDKKSLFLMIFGNGLKKFDLLEKTRMVEPNAWLKKMKKPL